LGGTTALSTGTYYVSQTSGQGCESGRTAVGVTVNNCNQTNLVQSIAVNGDGMFTLRLQGAPGARYYLVVSGDLTAPMTAWAPVAGSTNTAASPSGAWSCVVSNSAPAFYRAVAVH